MFVEINIQIVWHELSILGFSLLYTSDITHLKQFFKTFLTKKVKLFAGVEEAGRG